MPETRRLSAAGLDLVKRFEGFRARPARLADGRAIYGYGHAGAAPQGGSIDLPEADRLLADDIAWAEALVNERILAPLTQAQFDALVSLAFSIGREAFLESEVARQVNAGAPVAAADAFDAWRLSAVLGAPAVLDPLVRRRAAEKALFLSDPPARPAPSAFVRPLADPAWRGLAAVAAMDAPMLAESATETPAAPPRPGDAPADIDLEGLNDAFAKAVEAEPVGPSGRTPPTWASVDGDEAARLRRIMAAHPGTAAALRPPPAGRSAPAPEPKAAAPAPKPPARAAKVGDTIGLAALGVLGAALLAGAAAVWGEGAAQSRWIATALGGPGLIAVAMSLYYLVMAESGSDRS